MKTLLCLVGLLASSSLAVVASSSFSSAGGRIGDGSGDGSANAEEARWLVNSGGWGTLSYSENATNPPSHSENENDSNNDGGAVVRSAAVSYADSNGRIFFYLMGSWSSDERGATLTTSEAALGPTSNFAGAGCGPNGGTDPEDPRCAKLSVHGTIAPCADDASCRLGREALFERHPEMKTWPKGHGFAVHEMSVGDVWMISNYGGGAIMNAQEYYSASPKHHSSYHYYDGIEKEDNAKKDPAIVSIDRGDVTDDPVPDWDKKVERARWIVAHSLWITVSTTSVRLNGSPWGNIRSIVDGGSYAESSGKPVFYLPTPDPTSVDVQSNPTISLTFSEAAIAERLDPSTGKPCGGLDPMDPLCGQVAIAGRATRIEDNLEPVKQAFGKRHPLAPWLAEGGAHTGGAYYTIEPTRITLLDYYGGATEIDVGEYLKWKPPSSAVALANQQLRAATE